MGGRGKMKRVVAPEKRGSIMVRKGVSPPPPPPPLLPRWPWAARPRTADIKSVTRDEIETFWRRKRMVEEDHLLAAQKAAARIRARVLTEEDYKRFEASVEVLASGGGDKVENCGEGGSDKERQGDDDREELRTIIKDWWTKSKFAYLNQPALESMDSKAAASRCNSSSYSFVPNSCFPVAAASPRPSSSSSRLGVC